VSEPAARAVLNAALVGLRVTTWAALCVLRPHRACAETRLLVEHLAEGWPLR